MARKVRLPGMEIAERDVVKFVMNYFAFNKNVTVWRRNTGALPVGKRFIRFGAPGMSDIYGIVRRTVCPICGRAVRYGVHIEIECKKYGGRLSAAQKDYLAEITQMNGKAVVAIPKPTQNDPTGFKAISTTLASLETDTCKSCRSVQSGE